MKRILFYAVVLIQIVIIGLLGLQYTLIDKYGTPIKIKLQDDSNGDYENYKEYEDYQGNIHLYYDINSIPTSKWEVDEDAVYNERVYVLLESDENGVFDVVKAASEKMTAKENQIVIAARNDFESYLPGEQNVMYGIEVIKNKNLLKDTTSKKERVATVIISPWGQRKVVSINN